MGNGIHMNLAFNMFGILYLISLQTPQLLSRTQFGTKTNKEFDIKKTL
jgi:hypothetical protein